MAVHVNSSLARKTLASEGTRDKVLLLTCSMLEHPRADPQASWSTSPPLVPKDSAPLRRPPAPGARPPFAQPAAPGPDEAVAVTLNLI